MPFHLFCFFACWINEQKNSIGFYALNTKKFVFRDINSNSAGETEELVEKQEKVLDQIDKKRKVIIITIYVQDKSPPIHFNVKVFQEIIAKGVKLRDDPKSPEFLGREVKKAQEQWEETNKEALDRLNRLRGRLHNFPLSFS